MKGKENGLGSRLVKPSETLSIGWYNGGGGILKRLKVNPGLNKFLDTKPDIFTYGESLVTSSQGLSLEGYNFFLHRSFLRDNCKCRRGLVVFFKRDHAYRISKVYSSRLFDIIWLRLVTNTVTIYICFFYAPGAHHEEILREKFYNTLLVLRSMRL